jgi:hypothetical protein
LISAIMGLPLGTPPAQLPQPAHIGLTALAEGQQSPCDAPSLQASSR